MAQAEKEREFEKLRAEFRSILEIHRVTFPTATKPDLPPVSPPDLKPYLVKREAEELSGVSIFRRAERKTAKARAKTKALEDLGKDLSRLRQERERAQKQIDEDWNRLVGNEPEVVIATVDGAFDDNAAPAVPVDVIGSVLSLVMLAPEETAIPERKPALTPSGKATVKKLTKQEAADTYLTLVCGHLLASTKEALAVAPSITAVNAAVVRRAAPDVYGADRFEAVLAAKFDRSDLDRVKWREALSPEVVQQASSDLLWNLKGRVPKLATLDLDEEPELKAFVDALSEKLSATKA